MILPPAILGMLGGGQLGRFFVSAAHEMGYQVWVLDPDKNSPAGQVAERHFCVDYTDYAALDEFGAAGLLGGLAADEDEAARNKSRRVRSRGNGGRRGVDRLFFHESRSLLSCRIRRRCAHFARKASAERTKSSAAAGSASSSTSNFG